MSSQDEGSEFVPQRRPGRLTACPKQVVHPRRLVLLGVLVLERHHLLIVSEPGLLRPHLALTIALLLKQTEQGIVLIVRRVHRPLRHLVTVIAINTSNPRSEGTAVHESALGEVGTESVRAVLRPLPEVLAEEFKGAKGVGMDQRLIWGGGLGRLIPRLGCRFIHGRGSRTAPGVL